MQWFVFNIVRYVREVQCKSERFVIRELGQRLDGHVANKSTDLWGDDEMVDHAGTTRNMSLSGQCYNKACRFAIGVKVR